MIGILNQLSVGCEAILYPPKMFLKMSLKKFCIFSSTDCGSACGIGVGVGDGDGNNVAVGAGVIVVVAVGTIVGVAVGTAVGVVVGKGSR
jgi:hypothetical protein